MPLFWLSLAFLGGIILSAWAGGSWSLWLALGLAGLLALLLTQIRRLRAPRGVSWPLLELLGKRSTLLKFPPLLLLVLFAAGGLRYELSRPSITPQDLAFYNNRGTARITGWVTEPLERRDASTLVRLRVREILLDGERSPHAVQGMLLAQLPPGAPWGYGDTLVMTGTPIDPPENEEFSYRDFLANQGVYTLLPFASVQQTDEGGQRGSAFLMLLYSLRGRAVETIHALYPSPEAPLLSGILLGVDSGIPDEVNRAFQSTGTAHIVAISG